MGTEPDATWITPQRPEQGLSSRQVSADPRVLADHVRVQLQTPRALGLMPASPPRLSEQLERVDGPGHAAFPPPSSLNCTVSSKSTKHFGSFPPKFIALKFNPKVLTVVYVVYILPVTSGGHWLL